MSLIKKFKFNNPFVLSITLFTVYILTRFFGKVKKIDFKAPKDMWE